MENTDTDKTVDATKEVSFEDLMTAAENLIEMAYRYKGESGICILLPESPAAEAENIKTHFLCSTSKGERFLGNNYFLQWLAAMGYMRRVGAAFESSEACKAGLGFLVESIELHKKEEFERDLFESFCAKMNAEDNKTVGEEEQA